MIILTTTIIVLNILCILFCAVSAGFAAHEDSPGKCVAFLAGCALNMLSLALNASNLLEMMK